MHQHGSQPSLGNPSGNRLGTTSIVCHISGGKAIEVRQAMGDAQQDQG